MNVGRVCDEDGDEDEDGRKKKKGHVQDIQVFDEPCNLNSTFFFFAPTKNAIFICEVSLSLCRSLFLSLFFFPIIVRRALLGRDGVDLT